MNKQLLITAVFALCGSMALALPAFAQTAQDGTQAQTAATAKQKTRTSSQRAVPPLNSRVCIRDTGSHIAPPKGQCLPVAGNSYDQNDIQRTGATNIGEALQMLDPSVRVHGH